MSRPLYFVYYCPLKGGNSGIVHSVNLYNFVLTKLVDLERKSCLLHVISSLSGETRNSEGLARLVGPDKLGIIDSNMHFL